LRASDSIPKYLSSVDVRTMASSKMTGSLKAIVYPGDADHSFRFDGDHYSE
jgi:hypothetical protein